MTTSRVNTCGRDLNVLERRRAKRYKAKRSEKRKREAITWLPSHGMTNKPRPLQAIRNWWGRVTRRHIAAYERTKDMTGTKIKAGFPKGFTKMARKAYDDAYFPKPVADHPRVRFHAGRDYTTPYDWSISVSWGLVPAEDQQLGSSVYRRCWELRFRFGIEFYRR